MHKYGREFSIAVMENRDNCVSDRVSERLPFSSDSHLPSQCSHPHTYFSFRTNPSELTSMPDLKVMRKLGIETPSPELVDAYLGEIAKGYGVHWSPPGQDQARDSPGGDLKVRNAIDHVSRSSFPNFAIGRGGYDGHRCRY